MWSSGGYFMVINCYMRQVESSQQGAEVQRFLSSLCGVCTRVTMPASPEWSELLRRVTLNAMTFASSAVAKGHDVNTLLLRLRALAKKQPQVCCWVVSL